MIFKDEDAVEPASWLARARAQSLRLADGRARVPRPWEPTARTSDRPLAQGRFQWAMAGALALLLLASGAWAVVVRLKEEPSPPPLPASQPAAIRAPRSEVAVAPPAPAPPAKNSRRKEKKAAPPRTSWSQPLRFEDGDGELILVAPHEPPTPLFSAEEWKRRR